MTRSRVVCLSLVALVGVGGGCQGVEREADVEDFRNGIPRQSTVEMVVPQTGGQALSAEERTEAIRFGIADFYVLTRAVSGVVNGAGALTLILVKAIVSQPPTSIAGDTAIWGPGSGALDPVVWQLTVKQVGDMKFSYELAGRPKLQASAAFTVVLSGTHTAAVDASGRAIEGFGAGTFTLDWDARGKLPGAGREVGSAKYTYSRFSPMATVEIDAAFRQVRDDNRGEQRVDLDYRFRSTHQVGGSMQFVHNVAPQMAQNGGRWAVNSRWTYEGGGRSDVRATGGDLPTNFQATASECWDVSFRSVFFQANWPLAPSWGTEATDCLYKTAEFSNL
jgi:hypothetical protein